MKKNIIIAVLGTIVVAFVILLIIGLSTKDEMVSFPIDDSIISSPREDFIGGCVGEGSTHSSCACAYDLLEKDMGENGIIDMSLEYLKTEKLPTRAVELVTPCFQ